MPLSFVQANFIVYESGDWKTQRLAVERTGGLIGEESGRVTIYSSRSANRAVRGEDYTSYTQELRWSDGEGGKKEVFFQPLSDEAKEKIEYATTTLRVNDGSIPGNITAARIYIIDSDLKLSPNSHSGTAEPVDKEMRKGILPIYLESEGIEEGESTIESIDYIQNTLVYTQMGGTFCVYGRLAATNIQVKDPGSYGGIYHRLKIKLGIKNTIGEMLSAKFPVALCVGRSEFFNLRNQTRKEVCPINNQTLYAQPLFRTDYYALGTTRLVVDAASEFARMEYFNGWTYLDEPVLMAGKPGEIDLIFSGQIPGELVRSLTSGVESAN